MDFETIIVKKEEIITENKKIYQRHEACGFSMIILDNEEEIIYTETYRGKNCVRIFLESLFKSTENLLLSMNKNVSMKPLTDQFQFRFYQISGFLSISLSFVRFTCCKFKTFRFK